MQSLASLDYVWKNKVNPNFFWEKESFLCLLTIRYSISLKKKKDGWVAYINEEKEEFRIYCDSIIGLWMWRPCLKLLSYTGDCCECWGNTFVVILIWSNQTSPECLLKKWIRIKGIEKKIVWSNKTKNGTNEFQIKKKKKKKIWGQAGKATVVRTG